MITMKSTPRLLHKKGFTLIELMMTIVVVGIISVPVALLINQEIKSVFISQDSTMARNLARVEMEKVNNMAILSYANIASTNFSNYEGYDYNVNRTVAYVPGKGNDTTPESLKEITVTVTKSNSTETLSTLITYIAKNISYGL